MQGIELAKKYYNEYGKPMLESDFADVCDRIAVGVVGEGSECLGYDDDLSRDHDFDMGFCLFIRNEDSKKFGFKLERAYAKLPKEFMGIKRNNVSPVGGNRRGVITIEDFYTKHIGRTTAPQTNIEWLFLPSHALLAASNGEVFTDCLGNFSCIRNQIKKGYPEDVRLKKIAAHSVLMAQSGQYNYRRLITRNETGAAQLAVHEFVCHAISTIYLLNNRYEPFYKWAYRGLRDLAILGNIETVLVTLTELDNSNANAELKAELIEDVAGIFIAEFQRQNITDAICLDLERHAYSINDHVRDVHLRNMHIMDGI